ncbi:MAG TPA: hypothetical protein VER79_13010, partial [Candidatus Limnocylindrales bacterium]|nr:hypothetical protein [Candidatus Limnocylindrales bacterium]
ELAAAVSLRTGPSANWCTFATWASKQAGQTIRREDLQRLLEDVLTLEAFSAQAAPELTLAAQSLGSAQSEAEVQTAVAQMLDPLTALQRASDAVARGNRRVFAEIGREFARFLATCGRDTTYDAASIEQFCAGLRPGDPPDGQRLLQQAFTRLYRALFEPDAKTRAELMLCANLEIGLHEQTRLQPEIAEAMNAAFVERRDFRARLLTALFPWNGWIARLRLIFLRLLGRPSLFDALADRLLEEARRQVRLLITEALMTLHLPRGQRLRLGHDLPGPFPASLAQITLPDLQALLKEIDPTPDSLRGSGALDWAELPHRLHFICDFFRAYHETEALFDAPFTEHQMAALKAGRLPEGRL